MNKRLLSVFLAALLIVSFLPAAVLADPGDTVYVDEIYGNDANDGSESSPYATLSYAITEAGTDAVTIKFLSDINFQGCGITAGQDITLDLNGHKLIGTASYNIFTVVANSTLTIDDTSAEQNGIITSTNMRGIETLGVVNLKAGTITCSTTNYKSTWVGAGIYVYDSGVLNMSGGSVSGCTSPGLAGGIYNVGEFNMTGGSITGCSAVTDGGGVYNKGTFNFSGGSITGCVCGYSGGGVCNGGTFNMSGGTISGCTPNMAGGGVYNSGLFEMTGGNILENTSDSGGGGVYNCGIYYFSDGTISDNSALGGGGIANISQLYISGNAVISGNSAQSGGGVYSEGILQLTGGSITNNSASKYGGVYNVGISLLIGGNAVIEDNVFGSTGNTSASNLYLGLNSKIEIGTGTAAPVSGMTVGISLPNPGVFTKNPADGMKDYFFSDDDSYGIVYDSDNKLMLAPAYDVAVLASTNGSVTADKTTACEGDTVNITISADSGYLLDSLSYNDGTDDFNIPQNSGSYSFIMPGSAVEISSSFKAAVAYNRTTDVSYETLTDAIDEAVSGDEIELRAASDSEDIILPVGVTLYTGSGYTGTVTTDVTGTTICKVDASGNFSYKFYVGNVYDIEYRDQGDLSFSGTHESGYPTSYVDGLTTVLSDATKDGYTFDGWFDNPECTGSAITSFDAYAFSGNLTLYAKWTLIPPTPNYTIIEGANSEWTQGSSDGLSFRSDAPFDKFVSVKVDGVVIDSSNYTASEGSTRVTLSSSYLSGLSLGAHTLEIVSSDGSASTVFTVKSAATPVPGTYTVTFNMNGHGTAPSNQTVESGRTATKPADPSADGYTFDGWYTDASFSTKFDFDSPITSDTTIYAKWSKNSDGGNSASPQTGEASSQFRTLGFTFLLSGVLVGGIAYSRRKKFIN